MWGIPDLGCPHVLYDVFISGSFYVANASVASKICRYSCPHHIAPRGFICGSCYVKHPNMALFVSSTLFPFILFIKSVFQADKEALRGRAHLFRLFYFLFCTCSINATQLGAIKSWSHHQVAKVRSVHKISPPGGELC